MLSFKTKFYIMLMDLYTLYSKKNGKGNANSNLDPVISDNTFNIMFNSLSSYDEKTQRKTE